MAIRFTQRSALANSVPLLSFNRRMAMNRLPSPERAISAAGRVDGAGEVVNHSRDPNLNLKVARMRHLTGSSATDCWEKFWEEGLTPWDLSQVTPVIKHLVQTGDLPEGRILVPGCGTGYDVVAMASPERYVVGLDISCIAVNKAKEWSSSLPNASYFTFLAEDFFTWSPPELFDMIFDYTFFCAIHPTMRSAWAKKVGELLKQDGELISLMYLLNDQEGGPPYNNSVEDYVEVLTPVGFKAISMVDNELAVKPRKELDTDTCNPVKEFHASINGLDPPIGGLELTTRWRIHLKEWLNPGKP